MARKRPEPPEDPQIEQLQQRLETLTAENQALRRGMKEHDVDPEDVLHGPPKRSNVRFDPPQTPTRP